MTEKNYIGGETMNANKDKEVELAVRAFTLFESGLSVTEISKVLDMPESTARYLISIVDYNTK
jgi:predicted transcriptional regulator